MSSKTELLNALSGQTYRVRGLKSLLPEDWPHASHPDYEEVKPVVDELIEKIAGSEAKLEWLQRGDFASFAGSWWPYAGIEEFKTLGLLTVWVIRWDDEIEQTSGSFFSDPDSAKEYIADTIAFVRHALHIDGQDDEPPESPQPTIESFRAIGESVSRAYNEEQRKILFDEIERYAINTGGMQDLLLTGRVPLLDEYWDVRKTSSAIGIGIALIEYAGEFSLPADVRNHEAMRTLYDKTCFIVALVNDVVTLQVRVSWGRHAHIVPLLCANDPELDNNVQGAVDAAMAQVQPAIADFEAAAAELVEFAAAAAADDDGDEAAAVKQNTETFVQGCRYIMTGNVYWSLSCARFGLDVEAADEEGVEFELAPPSAE